MEHERAREVATVEHARAHARAVGNP